MGELGSFLPMNLLGKGIYISASLCHYGCSFVICNDYFSMVISNFRFFNLCFELIGFIFPYSHNLLIYLVKIHIFGIGIYRFSVDWT